ncbi:protein RepA [Salmonella enterica]|uniref:RepB family plasmid replication initiator protein n=1 Tax=Citrobacter braakii TaxID=57706 RepID=UPI00066D1ADD|nr:RepB family plasmid replication initiator protein [Citrobacter braakii]EAT1308149.1 protein RepA [Salmonella enterica]EFG0523311.1 protein RepA [Escherichia coli]EIL4283606.1 protein RepA [Salmonella enterica subsp. enterica serovar Thompson]EBI7171754.1 protein RepA [Salmonella enterica]EBT5445543.1 protein RepA [Salmonella enterica]
MSDNNFFPLIEEITSDGEAHQLTVTSTSSIQPAILLRLGVFVPGTRAIPKGQVQGIDVSAAFSQLEFARKEGYDEVRIFGERLNISTDFSVWMGVIGAFSKYGMSSNTIDIPFTEFASLCQYDSRQFNKRLRDTIFDALTRIGTKTVQFKSKKTGNKFFTQLLKNGKYTRETDMVTLQADERLWELYQIDYNILLRKRPYHMLKGKEVAQTLYTFIASLPDNPAPLRFDRIIERLNLTSPVKEQNRLIKAALKQLQDIGYIEYSIVKDGRTLTLLIHKRNKKLKELES